MANKLYGNNFLSLITYDGTNWSSTSDIACNNLGTMVVFNNSLFAANNDSNAYLKITCDGTTWDSVSSGINATFSLAEFNNSLFIGCSDEIRVSTNGITWDTSTDIMSTLGLASYNNSLFAGTNSGNVYHTTNGITWDTSTLLNDVQCLTVFNNTLFAGTWNNKIYKFSGTTWDLSTSIAGQIVSLYEFNNSLFAATYGGIRIIFTTDGTSWDISTQFSYPDLLLPTTFATFNNSLFAGGIQKIIVSNDGLSWDVSTIQTAYSLMSYGGVPSPPTSPTVTTQAVSGISYTTATGNGNITSTGRENPSLRGFAYDTSSGVDITKSVSSEAGSFSTGAYSLSLASLNPSITYYVKAFASNSVGLSYGNEVSFTTGIAGQTTIFGTRMVAQQFSFPKTASLNRVNLSLSRTVGSSYTASNIIVKIQENDTLNNIPSGSTVTQTKDNFTDTGYKNFYFSDRPLLKGNDKYWIVVSAPDANYENAYNWSSTSNSDNTRYRARATSPWTNTTTAAQNFSAYVPHDRFNYQSFQGVQTSAVATYAAGDDFYTVNRDTDMERIFNDITVIGAGDGINQVSARALDSASITQYGRRQNKIEDKSITNASDCQCVANTLITKYAQPVTVYDISMEDPNIVADIGDLVTISADNIANLNNSSFRVITQEDYVDITQDKINMHLNNAKTNFLTDVDKLKKDKDLEHNFGQGATNIFQVSEEDNCDDDDGLDLRFYIPDEAVAINSIKMRWGRKSFRAYSLSVCGGGGVTETTTNDGGFSQTSDGDISPTTITSFERVVENALGPSAPIGALAMVPVPDAFPPGGSTFGYTQFTGNVINQTGYDRCVCAQLCFLYFPTLSFVGYIGSVSKMMANGSSFYFNGYTNTEYSSDYWIAAYFDKATCGLAPSDTIGLSAQSILNHTHITTVGDHTHKVTIPNHTHQICYGIYEPVSEDNVCVDVFVDTTGGTPTHTFTGIPVNYNYPVDIELSSHITTVGWHCIYLKPKYDSGSTGTCHNARLHANAFAQVYIESK